MPFKHGCKDKQMINIYPDKRSFFQKYDFRIVDRIHLMTYDFHGRWEDFVDVHSPLFPRAKDAAAQLNTQDGALNFNNGGCPRFKLIVGVPYYGYKYILQNAGQSQIGAPSNKAATALLPDGGALRYPQV